MAMAAPPSFGGLLKRYRLAASLTQETLASRAGMSAHGISALERGARHTPYPHTVALLASALELSPRERALFEASALGRPVAPPKGSVSVPAPGLALAGKPALVGRARELELITRHLAGDDTPVLLL